MDEHMIELQGMRLANRAYLYRIFHIVFGAEPSKEELAVLTDKLTTDAFQLLTDDSFVKIRRLLESLNANDEQYLDTLLSEYTRLFQVPGESYVYPWESPYIHNDKMLFQESTLDVRKRYREYGFEAVEYGHFPEDHLSMMLDFLAHLSSRAFDSFSVGRDDDLERVLLSQQSFVADHLLNWLPSFCDELSQKDRLGFFIAFAEALHAFLQADMLFMEE